MIEESKKSLQINYWFMMTAAGLMLVGGIIAVTYFLRTNVLANKKIAEAAEAERPANLDIVTITDKNCPDCFDLNLLVDQIKAQNIKLGSEKNFDGSSDEGKELIKKFNISRLPTFIMSGELEKNGKLKDFFSQAGETIDGSFVFRQVAPPYTLPETGEVKGRIKVTLLADASCDTCYDVTKHQSILEQFGITVPATTVDIKSVAGRTLINKYKIRLIPTLLLSGETSEYFSLTEAWKEVGTIATDGTYIFTQGVPFMGTYRDLTTNKVITPPAPTSTQP